MASPADVGEVAAVRPDLSIPEQHIATEAGEDIDYVAMPKASCQRASVLLYLGNSSTPTALRGPGHRLSGPSPTPLVQPLSISSTALPLISSVKRSRICELYTPSSPFCLKDTFYGGGLGSSIAKSDLIDHDQEEGTHEGSSKVKQPMCDIKERTMGLCSSNWKDTIHEM